MRRIVPAALLLTGALLGTLLTVTATRVSRSPGNPLYGLRARVSKYVTLHNETPPITVSGEPEEFIRLQNAYGSERNSLGIEEWIVRDFFKDRKGGVFVDIGAADYRSASNTWFLESRLGWSGIAVDAQEIYKDGYEIRRPATRFFTFFISDRSNDKARLFLSTNSNWVASSAKQFTGTFGPLGSEIEIPTITMNDLLAAVRVDRFDFLSMDIELSEPEALAGFDIGRFRPALVCIEAHLQVRQQILDYFAAHDYKLVGKYLRVDQANLWFSRAL